jgi:hypothetical protein
MSPNTTHRPQEPPSGDTVRAPDERLFHCTADRANFKARGNDFQAYRNLLGAQTDKSYSLEDAETLEVLSYTVEATPE